MILEEQLLEAKDIKAIVLQGMKDSASAGSLLGYTTNNTKVTYEGTTATKKLLNQLNNEIVTIEANIAHLKAIS